MVDFGHDIHSCFGTDHADCRRLFREACEAQGATLLAHPNPNRGPRGEALATDEAWFGPEDASRVLVMISGVHGGEGFCGSGAQVDWLRRGGPGNLPEGVAALLVHALNPHGFAWLRRVTEEGVDLNRNWVDFDRPLPANPGYEALADAFVPPRLSGPLFEAAEARIKAWRAEHGEHAFQIARSGGQYVDPTGHAFGGRGPTWSRRTLEGIAAKHDLAGRDLVAVVDYHTGQGPHGYGEPICALEPDSFGHRTARQWYGESVTSPALGTSTSVVKQGVAEEGWARMVGAHAIYVALEFGTYDAEQGRRILRQDYWLHKHGNMDWDDPETQRIKRQMRDRYYPDRNDWREMMVFRGRQIQRQALAGLTG